MEQDFLNEIGKRIRQLRKQRNLSQLDLAVAMDNYAEQIGRLERGKLNLTICTLKKLCEALNISIKDFFDF